MPFLECKFYYTCLSKAFLFLLYLYLKLKSNSYILVEHELYSI